MISVVVRIGPDKEYCDDAALVNEQVFNNESAIIEEAPLSVFVADGVGGNAGGKEASAFLLNAIKNTNFNNTDSDGLYEKLLSINDDLLQYALSIPGKEQMATTLTGFIKLNDGYYLVHIGNTRMYVKQGSYLKQITTDQTQYQKLIDLGRFEEAEMCNKSVITGCFGGGKNSYVSSLFVRKLDFDRFPDLVVLTSDGIHDYLDIDILEDTVLADPSIDGINSIIQKAIDVSSDDDKTVIVIKK